MKTIHKYPLTPEHTTEIPMPKGAQILWVATQRDYPHIWALVDPSEAMELRRLRVVATGEGLNDSFRLHYYVGSFLMHNDTLVYHVFELDGK